MDLSGIHFHDAMILRVVEDTQAGKLTMEVNYPVDWEKNEFATRFIEFKNVLNYRLFEGPFEGSPTILDVKVLDTDGRRSKLRLDTNAGYRELSCTTIRLLKEVRG